MINMKKDLRQWLFAAMLMCSGAAMFTACSVTDTPVSEPTVPSADNNPLFDRLKGELWYSIYDAEGTVVAKTWDENGDAVHRATVEYSHVMDVYKFLDNGVGYRRRFYFSDTEFKPHGVRTNEFYYSTTEERPQAGDEDLGSGRVMIDFKEDTFYGETPEDVTLLYDDDNIAAKGINGNDIILLPASDELSKIIVEWGGPEDEAAGAGAAAAGAGIISLEGIATLDWHGLLYLLEPNKRAAIIGVSDHYITDISVDSYHNTSFISTAQVYLISRIAPGAFRGMKHLRSINLTDCGILEIGDQAFKSCKSLVTATVPASCTVLGKEAYMDCTNLKTANMPGVKEMGESCFENCSSMTTVSLSREGLVTIPRRAFYGCRGLMSLEIPDCVVDIEAEAFRGCAGFNPLILPKKLASVGDYAFEGCTSLITLTCHNDNLKFGKYAFANCTSLLTVTPGQFYSKIDETVFSGCRKLRAVPKGL